MDDEVPANEARPLAVVTGASSGIGAAFARRLARDGHDVVLIARRADRLDALAAELADAHGVSAEPLAADLTDARGREAVVARIERGPAPALLVNAAGFARYGPFAGLAVDDVEQLVAVHVRAVARLTHAAARTMIVGGGGSIVNVASRLALSGTLPPFPLPYRALYAGVKSFQLAFSQALALELADLGVRVQALLPGLVATEFHGAGAAGIPADYAMRPEDVVDASLAALATGQVVCAPDLADGELIPLLGKVERAIVMAAPASSGAAGA